MYENLTQFGVAGLMGALWVWERAHSRTRERQITESHDAIMDRDRQHESLLQLVRDNTRALSRFEQTQNRMCQLLENMTHEKR